MALALNDRVKQQGTANTTVSFTLTASVLGFQDFTVVGNGNTTYYAATDLSGNWECGIGTYSTTGPTLTRTTILSSSNSGSAVTFSGTVDVWVTYPSEKSVNLDSLGNVSALGTITSGIWNAGVIPVTYGGTGVTASSGPNSVVLRDADENIVVNSVTQELTKVTSAGGTTVLAPASSHFQVLTGTTTQTFQLPNATSLPTGSAWIFDNDSTGNLYVVDNASGPVDTIAPGGYATVVLKGNGTVAGEWLRYGMVPSEVNWGTNSLDLGGSTVITNGTWNGTPIAYNYGGTGLTTFAGANNALYSTSASALTAGTLPVAAGGTGSTTLTANNVLLGNGTSALQTVAPGTSGNVLTSNGTTWTSTAPVTGVTVTNDTSTATALYPTFTNATSGSISGVSVTSTKLNFTPSTGALAAPEIEASNGMLVHSKTVSTSYSIPSGSNAIAAGPVTVASGATVTIPSGSRWLVL